MTDRVPDLFRTINARLIKADNIVLEKILKIFYGLSVLVFRQQRKKEQAHPIVVIHNFDGNIKMKLDRSRSIGASLYWTGFHEFHEMIFLHQFLKKDMIFADVGANQGEYTLFAAKRVSRVLAFEPLASMRNVLSDNVALNGFKNVDVFEVGLSDHAGMLEIHEIENMDEGLGTIYLGNRKSKRSFTIQLQSLDAIAQQRSLPRLDFIKMDIEGSELRALEGSVEVIKKFRPAIMIELNAETYAAAGYTVEDVEDYFKKANYAAFEIGRRGLLKKCNSIPSFGNLIFLPS